MSEDLTQIRKDKIQLWEDLGYEGYARKYDRTHTAATAKQYVEANKLREDVMTDTQSDVALCGRIINAREMGKLAFLRIRDVSGDFQICLAKDVLGEDFKTWLKALDLGDYAGFQGEFFVTKHGEPTLMVAEITPLSKAVRSLPEKWKGLQDREACYRERNLDLMTNPETFERFQIRSRITKEIREFFWEKDFEEVETRVLQPQAGGAMAKVFETHHNALDHAFVLRIALELDLKMACSGGMERIFEIGKNFRNEGTDPSHLQEFTMLEWYAAYKDLDTNIAWTEALIHRICDNVLGTSKITVLDKDDNPVEIDFSGKFAVSRFPDLISEHAGFDMMTISDEDLRKEAKQLGIEDVEKTGRANLLDDVYKKTARPKLIQPTFVLDYPEDLKPLARPNGDGTASCFQLLIAGWEVVNSYGELINPMVQRELFERQAAAKAAGDDEAMEFDEEFLKSMEHGFPPMTGSGIGIDRLAALLTGQPNLRDVVLFPTMKPQGGSEKNEATPKAEKSTAEQTSSVVNDGVIDWDNMPDEGGKRFIAVLNKKVPTGKLFNALGHITAGMAANYPDTEELCFLPYEDADGGAHPAISHYPFIVLKADNSNKVRKVRNEALDRGIMFGDFTESMTIGTSQEQVANTKASKEADLEYFGIVLFGDTAELREFTGKFSLFQ